MHRKLITLLALVLVSTPTLAQRDRGGNRLPAVGTQLPELNAYDEFGNKFSTSSLRGSYSVLVFGCLT